jgi:hypothetical protein
MPDELQVVPRELLEAMAAHAPQQDRNVVNTRGSGCSQAYRFNRAEIQRRAKAYLDKIPGAISGNDGHKDTFKVACILVLGFDLSVDEALPLMQVWNEKCQPPWDEKDLLHKLKDADKKTEERGSRWSMGRQKAQAKIQQAGTSLTWRQASN